MDLFVLSLYNRFQCVELLSKGVENLITCVYIFVYVCKYHLLTIEKKHINTDQQIPIIPRLRDQCS